MQYGEDLLRDPPEAVEYVRHVDAAATGELEWGPSLRTPRQWRNPLDAGYAAQRAMLSISRRAGLLLPDPVLWLRVSGEFDLVHVHCTPVRFIGHRPPVLLSDSAGTFWYWSAGLGMPAPRVDRLLERERRFATRLQYLHPTVNPASEALAFFVPSGIRLAARLGIDASSAVVCPPGVPPARRTSKSDGRTVLFVARAFDAKGGPDVLRIFERVRESVPTARLLVAGSDDSPPALPDGVEWLGRVSREELYEEVYPSADVFLYPTRFDTAAMVVQEALAHGLPVVGTRTMAMPDLIREGETGRLFDPGDIDTAVRFVAELLTDDVGRARMGTAAVSDFERRFSTAHRNKLLEEMYRSLTA